MNWKEFKESVESQGVTDDMNIEYIDVDDLPVCVRLADLVWDVVIS